MRALPLLKNYSSTLHYYRISPDIFRKVLKNEHTPKFKQNSHVNCILLISKLALSSKTKTEVNDEEKFLTLIYPHVSSSYEKDLKS